MTADGKHLIPSEAERKLVDQLSLIMLQQIAPEELVLYDETAEEYFRDPELTMQPKPKDEAVGFGLELAMYTPCVLAIATAAVRFLATAVANAAHDELSDELKPIVADSVRRLFRRQPSQPKAAHSSTDVDQKLSRTLSPETGREIRRIALQRARQSGIDDERAALLADALVGALFVQG
jgi:hypothetical protein